MNRNQYFKKSEALSFKLIEVPGGDLRLTWPRGSGPAWKAEFERLTKVYNKHKKEKAKKPTKPKSRRARKRRAIKKSKVPVAPPLKRPAFKAEAPAKKTPRTKTVFQEASEKAIEREKRLEQKKRGKVAAEAAAEIGLRRRKKWNVTITAKYNFGTRRNTDIQNVFIQFNTRAFTEAEVRNDIDRLRELWESEQPDGQINGMSNYVFVSYTRIDIVDISDTSDSELANLPMLGTKFGYKLLGDLKKINVNPGKCVPDYLLYEFSRNERFQHMTEKKIIKLLGGQKEGYTTNDIIDLAKTSKYISVHALTPMLEVFMCYKAETHCKVNLCFIVNNDHCYPILDKIFKNKIIYNNKLSLDEFTFEVDYTKHSYFATESEFLSSNEHEKICLVNTNNLSNLAHQVMDKTGQVIQGMKFYYSTLISFEHPDGTIVEYSPDYHLRVETCKALYKEFPIKEFIFRNQTWATISNNLYKYKFNDLKKSFLSEESSKLFETYPIGPYIKKINEDTSMEDILGDYVGFDKSKSYTQVLLENEDEYPIFTPFDEVESINKIMSYDDSTDASDAEGVPIDINWVPGEYYINKTFYMARKTIKLNKGFYPLNITRYCIDKKFICLEDIEYYKKSGMCLKADHFKDFVEYCYKIELIDDIVSDSKQAVAKRLVNFLIGLLNKKYKLSEKGCITDSYKMACGTFAEEMKKKDTEVFINKIKDLYIIRSTKKERLSETSSPIWRHIIAGGLMNLDKMHSEICNTDPNARLPDGSLMPVSVVISYKVDAIFIKDPRKDFVPITKEEIRKDPFKAIGRISEEDWSISGTKVSIDKCPVYIHKRTEWIEKDFDHSEELKSELENGSYAAIGMSGSSKSTMMAILYKKAIQKKQKIKVLCFTNKAVSVLKKKGVKDVQTFCSLFYDRNNTNKDAKISISEWSGINILKNYDGVWVDEFGMVPYIFLALLQKIKKMGKEIRLFGDNKQCSPIEDGVPRFENGFDEESGESYKIQVFYKMYDYEKSSFIKELCDNKLYKMQYVAAYGRYDDKLYKSIMFLNKHNRLHRSCRKKIINRKCWMNIAYHNKICDEVNDRLSKLFMKKKTKQTKNKKWAEKMPVICDVNSKKNNLNNSQRYIIKKINNKKNEILLEDNEIPISLTYFSNNFSPGFCITVHRMQGDEITEPYNIYETDQMSKQLFYTAIGRGKRFDDVNFEYTDIIFKEEKIYGKSIMLKKEPKKPTKEELESAKEYKKAEEEDNLNPPKIQIVQDVHINKKEFVIRELKDMYIIQYREDGKKKNKKVRFGKRTTKEDALKKITDIQKKLSEI